ncbi:hypothetical protein SISSUDRAFT_1050694 [Sistotremastrum suecicum HHB10207 ss-3]|uniref:N-glycosylation protein EOS1 n=1 Tax=Sistotremastrum suecicum HHB10207 ss-3 TaxID=1314776 RepID=A0A166B182_9AGAM|nr:hypothetical protein SISSUDRAFT_1050694 [Sistotremastrum suecicum HHB10207 ss-3]
MHAQSSFGRRVQPLANVPPLTAISVNGSTSHHSPKSASASEPSSPTLTQPPRKTNNIHPSHSILRSRSKSAASLENTSQTSRTYFTPSTVPLVGPAPPPRYQSEEDEDNDVHDHFWTGMRYRPGMRANFRNISTGQGTETEDPDEPSRPLPTARIVPPSLIAPPNRLQPLLFQAFRLLSIVPAVVGTLVHIWHIFHPPAVTHGNGPIDFGVAVCWAILTAYQHLSLTTGLLSRWRYHYAPFAVIIRLLGLQAICWPATHITLTILQHDKRPVVCWAVIGSTTSVSRSIQMWVTSNLWIEQTDRAPARRWGDSHREEAIRAAIKNVPPKTDKRRWDWNKVIWRCGLPMGICYFIMAWADVAKRELGYYDLQR